MQDTDGISLSGCIEKNGNLGKIDISPFTITIKGLDTDYELTHQFKMGEWGKVIGYLQSLVLFKPSKPPQVVDRVGNMFAKNIYKFQNLNGLIPSKYRMLSDCDAERIIQK